MIYLPPRAQRMEKFRGLLKIDPLIKPQISLCALCALCGEISSGNCWLQTYILIDINLTKRDFLYQPFSYRCLATSQSPDNSFRGFLTP